MDSRACASIGSPSFVPVPCASTTSTPAAVIPASASAARMTRCCDGPFGAVRPFEAPSWFTAVPLTTASTGWPLRRASDRRSTSIRATPSPHAVPSALAENGLQRLSVASPACLLNSTNVVGVAMIVAPPTRASEDSPFRRERTAMCSATSDDEHAVSTVTAGPSRPST